MLTLRRLKQLTVLAEESSFTRAARRLMMTQPALSRSVALLEEESGLLLFERTANGVVPTKAGRQLLREARKILGSVDVAEHNLRLQGAGDSGTVSFAVGPLAANHLLANILSRSLARSPGLTISAHVLETPTIINGVREGSLDFGICTANTFTPTGDLDLHSIASLQMILVVRAGHPALALERFVRWDDLHAYPRATGRLAGEGEDASPDLLPLEPTVQCNDFEILRKATLTTDTVWLTARETVQREIADGLLTEIVPLPVVEQPTAEIVMVTLRGRSISPATARIVQAVMDG